MRRKSSSKPVSISVNARFSAVAPRPPSIRLVIARPSAGGTLTMPRPGSGSSLKRVRCAGSGSVSVKRLKAVVVNPVNARVNSSRRNAETLAARCRVNSTCWVRSRRRSLSATSTGLRKSHGVMPSACRFTARRPWLPTTTVELPSVGLLSAGLLIREPCYWITNSEK